MKRKLILAAAALGVVAPVFAAPGNSYIDGYYVSASVEGDDAGLPDLDGDGFGVKGAIELAPQIFLAGEYQSNKYDDLDFDVDGLRIGAAFGEGAGNGQGLYGKVQYLDYDVKDLMTSGSRDSQSGIGGFVGYSLPLTREFKLYAEGGYIKLDDIDGPEFLGGVAYQFAPNIAMFADYRITSLEDESNSELEFDDFRIGARFLF